MLTFLAGLGLTLLALAVVAAGVALGIRWSAPRVEPRADDPCPACAECVGRAVAREVYSTPGVLLVPIVCQGVPGVAGPFAVRWGDA